MRKDALFALVLGVLRTNGASPLLAARIEVAPTGSSDNSAMIITVAGGLELADGAKFASIVCDIRRAIVVLASDGGNLHAGLQIGTIIRLRNFATLVPKGAACASACALAWLGGTTRFMQAGARIGFHAAYTVDQGQPSETGVGNALLGAYLNRIGLSDDAVVYITAAHPDEMTWLTVEAARLKGIDVALLPPVESGETEQRIPPPPPRAPSSSPVERSAEEVAGVFVNEFLAHWSESNAAVLDWFERVYADSVMFYGKTISRQ